MDAQDHDPLISAAEQKQAAGPLERKRGWCALWLFTDFWSSCLYLNCFRPDREPVPRPAAATPEGANDLQAPVQPKTAMGEMLSYYLKMEPHLFKAALEEQFQRLQQEKEERDALDAQRREQSQAASTSKNDLVLYRCVYLACNLCAVCSKTTTVGTHPPIWACRRMAELGRNERRASLEDLMYVSVLEKFLALGVPMLTQIDTVLETHSNLKALTEGIHSQEALEMVREHVRTLMGPTSMAFSNQLVKMPKLQSVQARAFYLKRNSVSHVAQTMSKLHIANSVGQPHVPS